MRNAGATGEKKVKGRKRLIGIDTLGNLLAVWVRAANRSETKVGGGFCERVQEKYPGIEAFCADAGFRGTCFSFVTDNGAGYTISARNPTALSSWSILQLDRSKIMRGKGPL